MSSSSDALPIPKWLPDDAVEWVEQQRDVLVSIYKAFDADGQWPNPGDLQRYLLADGQVVPVVALVEGMPPVLGSRMSEPNGVRVRLSLFGLACLSQAQPLLKSYIELLKATLARYADPTVDDVVSREWARGELGVDDGTMDKLSIVVLADCPFLAGGRAGVEDWELMIDPRILQFHDTQDLDSFLARVAEHRQLRRPAVLGPVALVAPPAEPALADELEPLRSPIASGVPVTALETFARWWQLETYLRDVVYVELRARDGAGWAAPFAKKAAKLAKRDEVNSYMPSADAGDLLAYIDASELLSFIEEEWDLFEHVLLPRPRWNGTVATLRDVRNRIAHVRRPHRDDPGRLAQTLRDLEAGAERFYGSYSRQLDPTKFTQDPVVRGWIAGRHPTAVRLLEHARRQYDIAFTLTYTRRPWSTAPVHRVSGTAGLLWTARWQLLGLREVSAVSLWERLAALAIPEQVVHVLMDFSTVTVSFPAIDDPGSVADAIGEVFDQILMASRPAPSLDAPPAVQDRWQAGADALPRRFRVGPPLAFYEPGVPLFAA